MKQPITAGDLAAINEQLLAQIREARGTLKDLRHEIKAGRETVQAIRTEAARLAETHVRPLLEAEVARQVDDLGKVTEQQMTKSAQKVIDEFDGLRDVLLGDERVADGREERSIPELLQDPAILARARHHAQRNAREAGRG
uniref:Uncharacterized protein n=1 Tax=Streptomyces sp. NBC_00093 TaxID=2975649 RepID=A0AAU2A2C4_9ACTN